MILVADSGSTKCDWRLIHGNKLVSSTSTIGLNPFFHDENEVYEALAGSDELMKYRDEICLVYFYGAGCSSEGRCQIIENGIRKLLVKSEIHVDHDVKGAAIASCQGTAGIACILGTGSNACFYDGNDIHQELPSLGYILGDEGSGSWFGKQLLRDYLYREEIPVALRNELDEIGKDKFLEQIYRKPNANVYLASFSKMLSKYDSFDYAQDLIRSGIREFLLRHVTCFTNHTEVPVNFVGSVAHYFQDFLKEEAVKLDMAVGNIIQKPIDGLVEYHSK